MHEKDAHRVFGVMPPLSKLNLTQTTRKMGLADVLKAGRVAVIIGSGK